MGEQDSDPLVLTLALDAAAQEWLEALRRAHFPPARNLVPAHVTLFHALPGQALEMIRATLANACGACPPAELRIGPPRLLGRGVALAVEGPAMAALRAHLAALWQDWLTPQDRQPWRPHATIQNKASPAEARLLHAALCQSLPVRPARAEALLLWHYRGGPWQGAGRFPFTGTTPSTGEEASRVTPPGAGCPASRGRNCPPAAAPTPRPFPSR